MAESRLFKTLRNLVHLPRLFENNSEQGPSAMDRVIVPTVDAFGSISWVKTSVSIVTGSVGTAVVVDSAGPAAPGANRTDAQGVSVLGEIWYVFGGYALHDDPTARNLAIGIQKRMPTGTNYQVQLFGGLGLASGNPLWISRPFVLDWLSKVYASTNGAVLSGAAGDSGTITAGQKIGFRYYYIPLQVGEYLVPQL